MTLNHATWNRKNARQALGSDSRYALADFLRDFSDDEAWLQWL
jgi:hypothetical protein